MVKLYKPSKLKPAEAKKEEASSHYLALETYSEVRKKEISGMLGAYIEVTDNYGKLISRLVLLLGKHHPKDSQDIVVRDLMSDVFDSLYESRKLILSGKLHVAFPLARRAFESLSLLHICSLKETWAEKWRKGRKISNSVIRKELAAHPLGGSEERMKEHYNFFCDATHPNRELIPRRFLGEGNHFVLGVIGKPNLTMITEYCMSNLEMWSWMTKIVSYFYRDTIKNFDNEYFKPYSHVNKSMEEIYISLGENFNRLLKEAKEHWKKNPVED
jgi:hypothetical protein